MGYGEALSSPGLETPIAYVVQSVFRHDQMVFSNCKLLNSS